MRMKLPKRIGALLLAIILCLGLFPVSAFADAEETAEPVHEHTWNGWTVTKEATCTEAGERQHACTGCGEVETESVPVVPHTFGDWEVTKAATCTEAGEQQHTCTVCGTVETEPVPVAPHTFGGWTVTKEATCTEAGERQHACTVCGTVETEPVPVAPHTFGDWEVMKAATCTEVGEQQHTCTVCGEVETAAIPLAQHSFGEWEVIREATCTKEGKQEHTCTVCGEVETAAIPLAPHSFGEWEVTREATCTKEGKQEHTCAVCGKTEKESIPMLPHSFGEWEVTREPTCTEKGKQERTCTVCGEVEKEYIPVAEHDWDENGICTVCGAEKPDDTKTFTVLWLNEDEKELERDEEVPEGTIPSYDGTDPVKDEDDDYTYEFSGWDPEPVPVTEDVTYTAQFTGTERRYEAMEETRTFGGVISVSVSAPEGAFPWGTEIVIAPAADVDVSSIAENAELIGAVQLSFEKNGIAQTAAAPVTVSVSMLDARNDWDTYKVFEESLGTVTAQDYGSSFSVTEAAAFGVARIPAEPFTVTFDLANGEEPVIVSVAAGFAIGDENMPAVPVKTNCDFEKWVDTEDGESEITAETVVTHDMTVLAVYKRQMPAVSFQKSSGGVYVSVSAEEGTFPAGTEMTVTPLGSDSSLEAMSDGQGEEVVATRVVDITFRFEGEEIQPEKPVAVTLGVAWYDDEQSIDVVHFSDVGGVSVVASDVAGTTASFAAEHFSAYGVIVKAKPPMGENAPFAKTTYDLIERDSDGNPIVDEDEKPVPIAFYIAARSANSAHNVYYLMDVSLKGTNPDMVKKTAANDVGSAAKYYFEPIEETEGYYRIRTKDGMYLQMTKNNNDNSHLKLVNGEDGTPTEFKVTIDNNGKVEIIASVNDTPPYLNLKSNDKGIGFQGYKKAMDQEFTLRLIFSDSITEDNTGQYTYDYKDPYDLAGKEFAVIYYDEWEGNSTASKAMTNTPANSNDNLQSLPVNVVEQNGSLVIETEDLKDFQKITWVFETVDGEGGGHYYLKTNLKTEQEQEDNWKYLQFYSKSVIRLVPQDQATIISVSPGTPGGYTARKKDGSWIDQMWTDGKYRFTWTDTKNIQSVAIASMEDEDIEFSALANNEYAQQQPEGSTRTEWFYLAAHVVKYTVKHWLQNIDDDEYSQDQTLAPDETKTGKTGGTTEATAKTLTGFTSKSFVQKTIAGDGTTVVDIYYDRNTFTVKYQPGDHGTFSEQTTSGVRYEAATPAAPSTTGAAGYIFTGWSPSVADKVTEDATYVAQWSAADVNYTVKHWLQNIDDDEYSQDQTLAPDETKTGKTGGTTAATAKTLTGFTAKTFEQKTIAGDGTTVVDIYYDRNTFTVKYQPGDHGTFSEQTTSGVRYEAATPAAPSTTGAAGYTFTGWSPSVADKVIEDATYVAQWSAADVNYTVKHWLQNIDDDEYSQDQTLAPDETKTGKTGGTTAATAKTLTGFTAKTFEQKTIAGDGTTVVDIYYDRNKWKVTYEYTGNVPKEAPAVPAEVTYKYGASVPVATVPTLTGYTFSGWTGEVTTMPDKDVKVTGSWSKVGDEIIVTISGVHATVKYDGEYHRILGYDAQCNNKEYSKGIFIEDGRDPYFSYEGPSGLYEEDDIKIYEKDVGTYTLDLSKLKFKNVNPNFSNVRFVINKADHNNVLTIVPRDVVMTSATDEKDYDGTALTNETVTVTGDGFVKNEGAAYTFTGTQTEEGSSDNTFTYKLNEGTLARNYNITQKYGVLTVNAGEQQKDVPLTNDDDGNTPHEPEDETPAGGTGAWALINLITAILTVCTGAVTAGSYFKKKEEEDGAVHRLADEEKEKKKEEHERKKSKFLGLIPGVGSIITFLLTEDMQNPMVLVDRWTVLMAAILAIGAALAYLTRNEKPDAEKPEKV